MNGQLIVTLTVEELKIIISEGVKLALQQQPQQVAEKLLKRKEVAAMFDISLVTLNQWMKEGRIPFHRIHSRIFFKQGEIISLFANPVFIGKITANKIRNLPNAA